MTLRELVQQSGGINSPVMDYELNFETVNGMASTFYNEVKQVVNMDQEQDNPKVLLVEIR